MTLARAIETGDLAQLPSRRDEDWRWTDLRGLLRTLPDRAGPGEAAGQGPFSAIDTDRRVVVVNGDGPDELVLTTGEIVELRFIATGGASVARMKIYVDGGSTLLLESYEAGPGSVMSVELEFVFDAYRQLDRLVISDCAEDAVVVSQAHASMQFSGSNLAQTILTNGSRRQRLETQVTMVGECGAWLDAAYLNDGQRHSDITTVVTHKAHNAKTEQVIKGVVADQARGVFQGRIVVEHGADRTDARMGHHALILSDKAEVDARPELLIFADDVQCAHGNTIGALDEDALFYARQRGIPLDAARAMLTEAFVGEVIDRIEHDGARDIARAWAAARLGGRE